MKITAAVARAPRAPFDVVDVELDDRLRDDEVLVRVAACGVCHTDLVCRDQEYPVPQPAVLGHEGAGVVERVGARVASVAPGRKVLLSYDSCAACPSCAAAQPYYCHRFWDFNFAGRRPDGTTPLRADGADATGRFFGQSAFATYCVARERNLVPVDDDLDLATYAPLGCGVQTGAGTVMNALKPDAGSSLVVFGCGTVGLSAVLGAVLAGCGRILAVDPNPARRELAREMGATDALDPREAPDVPGAVRDIVGEGGARTSVECTGLPAVATQALECLAPRGTCAIVGAAPLGASYTFDVVKLLVQGWTVRGVIEGESRPKEFLPRLIALHRQGRFPFERMIRRFPLAEINAAVAASERGEAVKPVLVM